MRFLKLLSNILYREALLIHQANFLEINEEFFLLKLAHLTQAIQNN